MKLTGAAPFLSSRSRTATAHLVSITKRGGDLRLWSAPSGERMRAFLRRFTIIEHPGSKNPAPGDTGAEATRVRLLSLIKRSFFETTTKGLNSQSLTHGNLSHLPSRKSTSHPLTSETSF